VRVVLKQDREILTDTALHYACAIVSRLGTSRTHTPELGSQISAQYAIKCWRAILTSNRTPTRGEKTLDE